jgi:drug/metabolite transporter (DMT)-like permease
MGFWGYAFVAIKSLLREISPLDLTVLRFFFVLIAILIFMAYEAFRGKMPPKIERKDFFTLTVLGFVGVVCYHLAQNFGEIYTSATVASLIVFTSPVFTAIFARIFLNERLTPGRITGIVLALSGAVLIAVARSDSQHIPFLKAMLGAMLVFISPISWSIYTIYGRKLGGSTGNLSRLYYSLYTMLAGSIFLMLFMRASTIRNLISLSFSNLINLLVLSLISSFFGYIIWVKALEYLEASELSVFLYLIPIFTTVFAVVFLNESLFKFFYIGAVLVFVGIYLTEKSS